MRLFNESKQLEKPFHPFCFVSARSCADVVRQAPDCIGMSGEYWIESQNGSIVLVVF